MSVINLPVPAFRPDLPRLDLRRPPVAPSPLSAPVASQLADELARQAGAIRALVVALQQGNSEEAGIELFVTTRASLQRHAHALETVCYRRLERLGGAVAAACREGMVYNDLIATLIDQLHHGREKAGALWDARLQVLRDLLDLRAERDQRQVVPLLAAGLSPVELRQVCDELVAVSSL